MICKSPFKSGLFCYDGLENAVHFGAARFYQGLRSAHRGGVSGQRLRVLCGYEIELEHAKYGTSARLRGARAHHGGFIERQVRRDGHPQLPERALRAALQQAAQTDAGGALLCELRRDWQSRVDS